MLSKVQIYYEVQYAEQKNKGNKFNEKIDIFSIS